jgi:hypothetical protein
MGTIIKFIQGSSSCNDVHISSQCNWRSVRKAGGIYVNQLFDLVLSPQLYTILFFFMFTAVTNALSLLLSRIEDMQTISLEHMHLSLFVNSHLGERNDSFVHQTYNTLVA